MQLFLVEVHDRAAVQVHARESDELAPANADLWASSAALREAARLSLNGQQCCKIQTLDAQMEKVIAIFKIGWIKSWYQCFA